MTLSIQIDYRETGLCTELDKLGTTYIKKNLVVGDIAYVSGDDDTPVFFCERKTYDDLNASIVSGRFRDQRSRLHESGVPFVFIIEGRNSPRVPQNAARTLGALENLAVKHRVGVIPTATLAETAKCVTHLQKKIGSTTPGEGVHVSTGQIVHRKSQIMRNVFITQLTTITGVSDSVANVIIAKYPTMASLMAAYAALSNEVEKETLLQDIPIKTRRLGPALSKRIYRAHHGLET